MLPNQRLISESPAGTKPPGGSFSSERTTASGTNSMPQPCLSTSNQVVLSSPVRRGISPRRQWCTTSERTAAAKPGRITISARSTLNRPVKTRTLPESDSEHIKVLRCVMRKRYHSRASTVPSTRGLFSVVTPPTSGRADSTETARHRAPSSSRLSPSMSTTWASAGGESPAIRPPGVADRCDGPRPPQREPVVDRPAQHLRLLAGKVDEPEPQGVTAVDPHDLATNAQHRIQAREVEDQPAFENVPGRCHRPLIHEPETAETAIGGREARAIDLDDHRQRAPGIAPPARRTADERRATPKSGNLSSKGHPSDFYCCGTAAHHW